jgi:uncharacterized membrane protein YeiH
MSNPSDALLVTVDLVGTFVFALEGAMAAIRGSLDFFGVMVLSFATALAGGIVRDVLIASLPPASLRDWRYAAVAFAAGAAVFFFHHFVQTIHNSVITVLDAAGLALFAMAGTEKALAHGMHPFIAVLLGTITGVGGGTVRDIFLAQIPTVLRSDIYAVAALLGSVVMIAGLKVGLNPELSTVAGGTTCFLLRVVSVWRRWNLPRVSTP